MGLSHLSPEEYVLSVAKKIRPSNLNDALLTLPFSSVSLLLECIAEWSQRVSLIVVVFIGEFVLMRDLCLYIEARAHSHVKNSLVSLKISSR